MASEVKRLDERKVEAFSNASSNLFGDPAMQHPVNGAIPVKSIRTGFVFGRDEVERLRALASRVAEIAALPVQREREKLWTAHNDLKAVQPMVFIDPEYGWNELIPPHTLKCRDSLARVWEMHLLKQIYWFEELRDDKVIEPYFNVPYSYSDNGWGIQLKKEGGGNGGAYKMYGGIEAYEEDFPKLHYPSIEIDYAESERLLELAHEVFDGILTVRRQQFWWWSMGMTDDFIMLRGFEEFLCDFLMEPEYIHRVMELLTSGIEARLDFLENNGLLSSNTQGAYVGSGGFGFTDDLPRPEAVSGAVHTRDMWGFFESQETSTVSPEMYGEFIFPYHKRLSERFGLNCFGCCESVTERFEYAKQLHNLRRVSISPWADWTKIPELLGKEYIASVKPLPTPLSMPNMNEEVVRAAIHKALYCGRNGILEIIMKDNNTLGRNPRNASRWVEICREEIAAQ